MVIPADWKMIRLADIGSAAIGLTYSPSAVADGGTLVLRSSNIQNEQLVFHNDVFVEMDVPLSSRVQPGDILVCARNGSRPLIGKSVLLDHRVEGMAFGAFMALFRSKFNNYVIHQFRSNGMRRQIEMHLGATINQITNSSLLSFEIPFPSSQKERDAIAEALSDADAAIESLDALIAKKRDVKQATMQQLLTGRTRLPGFTADWKEFRLGEICEIYQPTTIGGKDFKESGEFVVYGANGPIGRYNRYNHEDPEVTVTCRGATCGTVNVTPPRVWITGNAMVVRPKAQTLSKLMLKYILQALDYSDVITGAAQPQITGAGLSPCQILVPPLKEQEAIAEVLSVMDDELEALTEQVSKLRIVKEGMMQDLLTGKVRLA